jgi:hypothetical protein
MHARVPVETGSVAAGPTHRDIELGVARADTAA